LTSCRRASSNLDRPLTSCDALVLLSLNRREPVLPARTPRRQGGAEPRPPDRDKSPLERRWAYSPWCRRFVPAEWRARPNVLVRGLALLHASRGTADSAAMILVVVVVRA
jgi:hypothetical protein